MLYYWQSVVRMRWGRWEELADRQDATLPNQGFGLARLEMKKAGFAFEDKQGARKGPTKQTCFQRRVDHD